MSIKVFSVLLSKLPPGGFVGGGGGGGGGGGAILIGFLLSS